MYSLIFLEHMLFNTFYYIFCKKYITQDQNKRAYFLVLKDSLILSIYSFLYTLGVVEANVDIIVFFQAHLVSDVLIGLIEYKEQMMKLEGLPHHIVYIIVNIISQYRPWDRDLYSYYLILEIPTFIRALGTVKPKWRSNFLFGMTMIVFRVMYHIYLLFRYLFVLETWLTTVLSICSLYMHVTWTRTWIDKYGVRKIE